VSKEKVVESASHGRWIEERMQGIVTREGESMNPSSSLIVRQGKGRMRLEYEYVWFGTAVRALKASKRLKLLRNVTIEANPSKLGGLEL